MEPLYGELDKSKTKIDSKSKHANVSLFYKTKHSSVASESLKLGYELKKEDKAVEVKDNVWYVGKAKPHLGEAAKPSNTGYEGTVSYVKDEWGDNDVSVKSQSLLKVDTEEKAPAKNKMLTPMYLVESTNISGFKFCNEGNLEDPNIE